VGGPGGGDVTGDVSPHAATVPLVPEEGRTTDGLAPDDERVAPQTSRVSLAEMERLLRAQDEQPPSPPTPGFDPEATLVGKSPAATRPDFPPPDEELTITVPRTRQARATGDFEATADFEATLLADLEMTRPSSSKHAPAGHATRDAPAHVNAEVNGGGASPAGASPYDDPAADAGPGSNADAGADAHAVGAAVATPAGGAGVTRGARTRRSWLSVFLVCAAVAVFAAGGAWLAFRLLRRPAVTDVPTQPAAPPPATEDARQQFEQKLAEAEALLAAGDLQSALARLREANELDPSNWRARRRLGDLLFESGAVRAAIEEYRAATRNAPEDFDAWKRLALMQAGEGLDRDAVESYRRFIALTGGESAVDPHDLLGYAVVLLRAGHAEEARALFQRLASSPDARVSGDARRRLDEMARAQPAATPAQQPGAQPSPTPGGETASAAQPAATPAAAQPVPTPTQPPPTPVPAPPAAAAASPAERYGRGVQLWSSNRGAALEEFRAAASGGNLDAHYYLGLTYVEGRNLRSLQRAEVGAALRHFQLAQRGGQHASQARGYAQQLEKEFDRFRRQ
jgi:tetratricopeptide (TPR) repeat protein